MLSHLNVVCTAPSESNCWHSNLDAPSAMLEKDGTRANHDLNCSLHSRETKPPMKRDANSVSPVPLIIAILADSLSMYQTVWAFARYTDHNIAAKRIGKTSSSWIGFFDKLKSLESKYSGTVDEKKETHLPPGLTNTPPTLPVLSSWLQAPSVKTNQVDNKLLSILMALASRIRPWRKVRLAFISESNSTTLAL